MIVGAVCLGGVSQVSAAPQSAPAAAASSTAERSQVRGFVRVDPSSQPQAGETRIQVPDPASDGEVKSQYGVGIVLLVLGGLIGAGFVVALSRIVLRRTWDSTDAPASQGRH